jgi:SynChlorMet cassette protein ScmC
MVEDIIRLGGGLFHGGLAVLRGRGYLFTAPPGGGKTTALSRMPRPWRVLADDAALVWPIGKGTFLASPLPTWGDLVRNEKGPLRVKRWRISESVSVCGVFLLKKAPRERLMPFPPLRTARPLYLAFSEHPTVCRDRDPFRKQIFRAACALARAVPSWKLELTRGGEFWHIIEDMLLNAEEAR